MVKKEHDTHADTNPEQYKTDKSLHVKPPVPGTVGDVRCPVRSSHGVYLFLLYAYSVKNKLDSLFFTHEFVHGGYFVPRTSQISFYLTRETAFAVFSCGSSNVNVLGMEIIV